MTVHLFFQCVGDPSRLVILDAIDDGTTCVRDLVATTGLSQSNVSHHLAKLRDCGLVGYQRRGKENHYHVHAAVTEALRAARRAAMTLPRCEVC